MSSVSREAPSGTPSSVATVATGDGVALSVHRSGIETGPVIVFVHGYPDDSHVWRQVIGALSDLGQLVTYDVRGSGASGAPAERSAYRLDRLAADLRDVVEAVAPDASGAPGGRVHLVAHDWGSTAAYHALDTTLRGRVASFTSISGPHLGHVRSWVRRQMQRGPRGWVGLAGQGWSSAYLGWFLLPGPIDLAIRIGIIGRLVARDRSRRGARVARTDLRHGLKIYRANLLGRDRRPPAGLEVPVQVIVPTRDPYVRASVQSDVDGWVSRLTVVRVDAGHWLMLSDPSVVAEHIRSFVQAHSGSDPAESTLG
ncbi:MAG TPA: alpha/beta fold hydrolase [Micromonosporaceae bacterium]|nr:alpha/beta fold hydrolase [Micromonosporaceae bacterium]